jgi:hypothetical protein
MLLKATSNEGYKPPCIWLSGLWRNMSRRLNGEEKWWWWCWSKKIECPSSLPPTFCTKNITNKTTKNFDGKQLTLMGRHHQQKSFPPFFNQQHCTESCPQLSLSLSLSHSFKKKKPLNNKKHHQVLFTPRSSHKVPEASVSYRTD